MKKTNTVILLTTGLFSIVALMVFLAHQGVDPEKHLGSPTESNHHRLIWLVDDRTGEPRIANVESLDRVEASVAEEEVRDLVRGLRNSDVTWDGTWAGLCPTIKGKSANDVLKQGESAIPHLYETLADKDRYIVSHVLLAVLKGAGGPQAAGGWLGLRVRLHADGTTEFYPEDIPTLQAYWKFIIEQS